MSARIDMLAGMALQGLLAHPHHTAHPMTADASALAARAVELARALDAALPETPAGVSASGEAVSTIATQKRR